MANVRVTTFLMALLLASPAIAAPDRQPIRSELVDDLLACQSIADASKRLACFDGQSATLATAQKKGDVVILSKQELKQTRRSLFGFVLPKFSLRGLRMDEPDIDRIDAKVVSVRSVGYFWSLRLDGDAGTWETTESIDVRPRPGDRARIKKGMVGGFLGTIGSSNTVRMRRVL